MIERMRLYARANIVVKQQPHSLCLSAWHSQRIRELYSKQQQIRVIFVSAFDTCKIEVVLAKRIPPPYYVCALCYYIIQGQSFN